MVNNINGPRVLVIGLDGGTFDLIKPWAQAGQVSTLDSLMSDGTYGYLSSVIPPLSPPAWTSFMTGKVPEKHGILDFTQREVNSYNIRFTNRTLLRGQTLWRLLSDSDKRVGIVNVPITYPPESVNGYLVSGLQTPNTDVDFTYPPELKTAIMEEVGDYRIDVRHTQNPSLDDFLEQLEQLVDNRTAVTKYLLDSRPVDLLMSVYIATDRVSHFFWKYMDATHPLHNPNCAQEYRNAILDIYQRIDSRICDLLKGLSDDTTVLIVSDHGFGPLYKEIDLNNWLSKEGFLRYQSANHSVTPSSIGFRAMDSMMKVLRHMLPVYTQQKIKQHIPGLRHALASYLGLSNIDWERTQAFSVGHDAIHINLKGREPQGVVEPSDYDLVKERIAKLLRSSRDPETGAELVEAVVQEDSERFEGTPDLIVIWKDHVYATRQHYGEHSRDWILPPGKTESMPFEYSGTHRPNGILIAQGKHIAKGKEIRDARIIDLAPTILYLLGAPVPEDMDGAVLTSLFTKQYLENHPIQYCEADEYKDSTQDFSTKEAESVEERLKGLGYL